MNIPRINIIGCGKVGKTLGRLWEEKNVFRVQHILNRSLASSQTAVDFIGAGSAVATMKDLSPADFHLIATNDDSIVSHCEQLVSSGSMTPDSILFHCSGALASADLGAAQNIGAKVASVHPVKSFADPAQSIVTFPGTFCGVEGDSEAVLVLRSAFEAIGGRTFEIEGSKKLFYHTASVIAGNYLTSLIELATLTYARAGIAPALALEMMRPLMEGTLQNIFDQGTITSLTGPIARGDSAIVARQLNALESWNTEYAELYRGLGKIALTLAKAKKPGADNAFDALEHLFCPK